MHFSFSTDLNNTLKQIKRKQPQLFARIQKQLHFFQQDHTHPSLRNHKLKGNLANTWSISIDRSIRMLYTLEDNKAVFFLIGTHDEVYEK